MNEVQYIEIAASGGTVAFTFAGETTAPVAWDCSRATLLAALEALPNIAPGDVSVGHGFDYFTDALVTFKGAYANTDVPLLEFDESNLTGGSPPRVYITTRVEGGS